MWVGYIVAMGEVVFSDCINVLWGVWGAYDFYLILDDYSTVHSFLAPQESREVEIHACGLCAPRMSLSLFAFLHWGVVGLALAGKVGRLPKGDGYPLCYAFLFFAGLFWFFRPTVLARW